MNLKIKQITESHQVSARKLILKGLGEHFGFIDESMNPDLNNIISSYINKGYIFLVGIYEGIVICTGALVDEGPCTGRIVRVSVDKNFRKKGIASILIKKLEACALRKGFNKVLVETNNDWEDAIGLYKKCGYSEYASDEESIYLFKML